ncbi:hypothetical protein BJV82DRAFT_583722 [Fennellomyces sp. T-0311]|nr:hypothetical protein BJV82DRAFT_583722 [Fennellomyces sp. T-0311]
MNGGSSRVESGISKKLENTTSRVSVDSYPTRHAEYRVGYEYSGILEKPKFSFWNVKLPSKISASRLDNMPVNWCSVKESLFYPHCKGTLYQLYMQHWRVLEILLAISAKYCWLLPLGRQSFFF